MTRIRNVVAYAALMALALSLGVPANADPITCTWVGDKWVCVPPEEDP